MIINYSGKKINLDVKKLGAFSKGIGLMFRSRETDNLLFDFKKETNISIHSFFVFFPFLAIWLDSQNNVLESRIVKPFCFSVRPKKHFMRLIEVPLNSRNKKIAEMLFFRRKKGKI